MGSWSSKAVALEPIEFDGDKVVLSVKRLLVEDMMVLTKFYNQANGKLVFSSPLEVCITAKELLPKYVQSISGLYKDDGEPMTVDEFITAADEFYFVPLVGEIFTALISVSTVRNKAKNSAPPSAESSEA